MDFSGPTSLIPVQTGVTLASWSHTLNRVVCFGIIAAWLGFRVLLACLWRDCEPLAGCGYGGVAGDNGIEPRDLEHPSHLRAGTRKANLPAGLSHREKAPDKDVCAGAVDLLDASQVEDQFLLVLVQQIADQRLDDDLVFRTGCDAAGEMHNDNIRFEPCSL